MSSIPFGGLVLAALTVLALIPFRRPRTMATLSWLSTAGLIEAPFAFMIIILGANVPTAIDGEITSTDWISLAVAALTLACLSIVVRRAGRTRRTLADARRTAGLRIGGSRLDEPDRPTRQLPWWRIVLMPWPFRPSSVERIANISYGPHGRSNLLDVYRHRSRPPGAPTLIHLHGGGFRHGRKSFESRAMLHHFAERGWTCISANYRLARAPARGFPDHLIDVKRLLAWSRTRGIDLGVDPDLIVLAGSSAGAHLTVMASLTPNEPAFQPDFEDDRTDIAAGIGLYGYYGDLGDRSQMPSSPLEYATDQLPPMFIIHGDQDTFTPVSGARRLVHHLRSTSPNPVLYAELPGAQHSFDLFHSIRFERVIDAVTSFADAVRSEGRDVAVAAHEPSGAGERISPNPPSAPP